MFCEQCGIKIEENERLCSECEEQKKIIEISKSDIISINGIKMPKTLLEKIFR